MSPAPEPSPETQSGGRLATLLYLLGLATFVISTLGFVLALAVGADVRLPLAANAAGVALVIAWAAHDTLVDPDAEVTSVPGALGTAMLLLAVYAVLAAVVVGATSPLHGRLDLALLLGGGAVVAGILGVVTFPLEVLAGAESADSTADDGE